MNIDQKIETILDNWEGTRMIEQNFDDPQQLFKELCILIKEQFSDPVLHYRTFKQVLFNTILVPKSNWEDCQEYDVELYELNPENWPTDEDGEPIDLENHEVLELTDSKMVFAAGGDWQQPVKMTIELVKGVLTVTEFTTDFEWQDGLSNLEIIKILTE